MDHKAKAKAAWQRSIDVVWFSVYLYSHDICILTFGVQNPGEWSAQLLLGIEALNTSKDEAQSEEDRREEFLRGTRLIERAFNANQKNSAAANALCELFLQKGQTKRVSSSNLYMSYSLTCGARTGPQTRRTHYTVRRCQGHRVRWLHPRWAYMPQRRNNS